MAFTPGSNLEAVEALYIAYFGRAGEPGGVDYWVSRMNQGMTFAQVAASFSSQPEAKAQHPYLSNPTAGGQLSFIESLYSQLLGRQADSAGLSYWSQALNNAGADPIKLGLLIAQFISGAQGTDIQTIQNKVDVAEYFTAELKAAGITGVDANGQVTALTKAAGAEVVDDVTSNPATVSAAMLETDSFVDTGTVPGTSGGAGGGGTGGGGTGGGGTGGGGSAPVTDAVLSGDVLILPASVQYNISREPDGSWIVGSTGVNPIKISSSDVMSIDEIRIVSAGGQAVVAASVLASTSVIATGAGTLNLTGVSFTQASVAANSRFEPSVNADTLINSLLAHYGNDMGKVFDHLRVDGGVVGAFQLLWDYIDDNYSYYNSSINESGIRLGLEYVSYLQAGGQPLTNINVKFAADGADAGTIPDRWQSLHDNLLGNLHGPSIQDKLAGSADGGSNPNPVPGLYQAMVTLVNAEAPGILSRGIVTGNEVDIGNGPYNSALAFDYEQGWTRPDYISFTTDGEGDARAIDTALTGGRYLFVGTGVPADQMATVENVGAGVELSFGIRHFGAAAYDAVSVVSTANGARFVFNVDDGTAPGRPDRAEWTFNPVVVAGTNGQDENLSAFRFELDIDLDPTAGQRILTLEFKPGGTKGQGQWVAVNSNIVPTGTAVIPDNEGNAYTSQNSHNFAFYLAQIDADPIAPGQQTYTYGAGTFDFELRAYDGVSLVGVNHVTVNVT